MWDMVTQLVHHSTISNIFGCIQWKFAFACNAYDKEKEVGKYDEAEKDRKGLRGLLRNIRVIRCDNFNLKLFIRLNPPTLNSFR